MDYRIVCVLIYSSHCQQYMDCNFWRKQSIVSSSQNLFFKSYMSYDN